VRALAAELLHEVVEDHLHERVLLFLHRVDGDVSEEDRVGTYSQVVLDFAQDDLLAAPAVFDDAAEPGMLHHRDLSSDPPELVDERIR
jgi:hypothetical protein